MKTKVKEMRTKAGLTQQQKYGGCCHEELPERYKSL